MNNLICEGFTNGVGRGHSTEFGPKLHLFMPVLFVRQAVCLCEIWVPDLDSSQHINM